MGETIPAAVAVKVTELPEHEEEVPEVWLMVTVGVVAVVCVMVMELEVAVAPVTQLSEEVMTQVTTPLFPTAAA